MTAATVYCTAATINQLAQHHAYRFTGWKFDRLPLLSTTQSTVAQLHASKNCIHSELRLQEPRILALYTL